MRGGGGGGGSEILSTLEFDVNSRLCSVLNVGGIRNSGSLRIGGNSRFSSVLSDRWKLPNLFCLKSSGIRNSEPFRIGVNSQFYSVLNVRGSEILSPSELEKIAYFVLFKMLRGSEILSPSESVEIADFVQFEMLGGSEIRSIKGASIRCRRATHGSVSRVNIINRNAYGSTCFVCEKEN